MYKSVSTLFELQVYLS